MVQKIRHQISIVKMPMDSDTGICRFGDDTGKHDGMEPRTFWAACIQKMCQRGLDSSFECRGVECGMEGVEAGGRHG